MRTWKPRKAGRATRQKETARFQLSHWDRNEEYPSSPDGAAGGTGVLSGLSLGAPSAAGVGKEWERESSSKDGGKSVSPGNCSHEFYTLRKKRREQWI